MPVVRAKSKKVTRSRGLKAIRVPDTIKSVNVAIDNGGVNIQTRKCVVVVKTDSGPLVRVRRKGAKTESKIEVTGRHWLKSVYHNNDEVRIDTGRIAIYVEPKRRNGYLVRAYAFTDGSGLGKLVGEIAG